MHLDANPVSLIRRPKENRARSRRLYRGEEERLLQELELSQRTAEDSSWEGCRNEHVRPLVILAIETAMRRGELTLLRWSDVHLADRFVRLHDTKNGEARDVLYLRERPPRSQSYQRGRATLAVVFFRSRLRP